MLPEYLNEPISGLETHGWRINGPDIINPVETEHCLGLKAICRFFAPPILSPGKPYWTRELKVDFPGGNFHIGVGIKKAKEKLTTEDHLDVIEFVTSKYSAVIITAIDGLPDITKHLGDDHPLKYETSFLQRYPYLLLAKDYYTEKSQFAFDEEVFALRYPGAVMARTQRRFGQTTIGKHWMDKTHKKIIEAIEKEKGDYSFSKSSADISLDHLEKAMSKILQNMLVERGALSRKVWDQNPRGIDKRDDNLQWNWNGPFGVAMFLFPTALIDQNVKKWFLPPFVSAYIRSADVASWVGHDIFSPEHTIMKKNSYFGYVGPNARVDKILQQQDTQRDLDAGDERTIQELLTKPEDVYATLPTDATHREDWYFNNLAAHDEHTFNDTYDKREQIFTGFVGTDGIMEEGERNPETRVVQRKSIGEIVQPIGKALHNGSSENLEEMCETPNGDDGALGIIIATKIR